MSFISRGRRAASQLLYRGLGFKPIGRAVCAGSAAIGLKAISRWASKYAKYVPNRVSFEIASTGGIYRSGSMFSAGGNDQIVRSIWLRGLEEYEAPLPRILMRLVQGAATVLDVGANSGLYAILSALAEPKCQVHAFEPFPPALAWLRPNVELNGLTGRITVVPAAAGAHAGVAELYVPAKSFGDVLETSSSLNRDFRKEHSEILKIDVVTLDEHVRQSALPPVSVLRIDVEGAEHLVLAGAPNILRQHRPWVFVEVLSDSAAELLEPIRAAADFQVLSMQHNRLVKLPGVILTPGIYNQLWYPHERYSEIVSLAAELNLPLVAN